MADEISDESLAFLYRAAASRGPGKRPVKVVSREKLLANIECLAVGADEEDDIDFEPEDASGSDAENSSAEEDENNDKNDDSENSESEDQEDDDELEQEASQSQILVDQKDDDVIDPELSTLQQPVCCLCLNQRFLDQEVIQCDLCGVSVHEACYGTPCTEDGTSLNDVIVNPPENQHVVNKPENSPTNTASSVEAWYCEPCLAGLDPRPKIGNVFCELCPEQGGALKRTNNGRWVHSLCAFYTPRVTFGDTFHLSRVSLAEAQRQSYQAVKPCVLCTDRLSSRCGLPVKCDAGMCRFAAHVTCAQRRGLLVDAWVAANKSGGGSGVAPHEQAADPYYICCPAHSNRVVTQEKRRVYAMVHRQEVNWTRKLQKYEVEQLAKKRAEFLEKRPKIKDEVSHNLAKPAALISDPNQKKQCLLSSNFQFMTKMRQKTQLLTEISDSEWADGFRPRFLPSMVTGAGGQAKISLPPALTEDFVKYFQSRDQYLPCLHQQVAHAEQNVNRLDSSQQMLKDRFEKMKMEIETVRQSNHARYDKMVARCEILLKMGCKQVQLPILPAQSKFNVATVIPGCKQESISKKVSPRKDNTSTAPPVLRTALKNSIQNAIKIFECATCHKTQDQHKLACCDTCNERYHLYCLDPPLTKMPRKTKQFGWECSVCFCKSSSSGNSVKSCPSSDHEVEEERGVKKDDASVKSDETAAIRNLRKTPRPAKRLLSESENSQQKPKRQRRDKSSTRQTITLQQAKENPIPIDCKEVNPILTNQNLVSNVRVRNLLNRYNQLRKYRELAQQHRAKLASIEKLTVASQSINSEKDQDTVVLLDGQRSPEIKGRMERVSITNLAASMRLKIDKETNLQSRMGKKSKSSSKCPPEIINVESEASSSASSCHGKIANDDDIPHLVPFHEKSFTTEDDDSDANEADNSDANDADNNANGANNDANHADNNANDDIDSSDAEGEYRDSPIIVDGETTYNAELTRAIVDSIALSCRANRNRQYSMDDLKTALSLVLSGESRVCTCSRKFNIPRNTFVRYVKRARMERDANRNQVSLLKKVTGAVSPSRSESLSSNHDAIKCENRDDGDAASEAENAIVAEKVASMCATVIGTHANDGGSEDSLLSPFRNLYPASASDKFQIIRVEDL